MRMASFMGSPEPFKPWTDDWCLYAQRFEHFLLANGVDNDSKQRHLLLALIGNSTFKLLANLVAPRKPGELRTSKFVNSYRNIFHRNQ